MAPPSLCEQAAVEGARRSGVPVEVLQAISLVETGTSYRGTRSPWPWAINRAGDGTWFANRSEALAFAQEALIRGETNLDIGCFQMNYRWHRERFSGLEEMLDPVVSARHAAEFLRELYSETGDWSAAAGRYHSRTPHLARSYRERFDLAHASFEANQSETARLDEPLLSFPKKSRLRLSGKPLVVTIKLASHCANPSQQETGCVIETVSRSRTKNVQALTTLQEQPN